MQINWCFSPVVEIEVPEGGEARLDCGPNRKPGGALNQVLKEAANYIWLRPEGDFPEH